MLASTDCVTADEIANATPEPIWKAVLIIPPQRLFTLTGTPDSIVVLAVMYAIETPITLIREVGRTFVQLQGQHSCIWGGGPG